MSAPNPAAELLESLDEIRDTAWAEMEESEPEDSRLNRTLKMLAEMAGAAIAKAEGR